MTVVQTLLQAKEKLRNTGVTTEMYNRNMEESPQN